MSNFIRWRVRIFLGIISSLLPIRKLQKRDKILILIGGGIGDSIMALPSIEKIKRKFPSSQLTIVLPTGVKRLIKKEIKPYKITSFPTTLKGKIKLGIRLEKMGFDVSFTTVVGVHSIECIVYSFLSRANMKLGPIYPGEKFSIYTHPYQVNDYEHDVTQNLKILTPLLGEVSPSSPHLMVKKSPPSSQIVIGIHPGGDRHSLVRRWSTYKFAKLVETLSTNYRILLFEGKEEEGISEKILKNKKLEKVEVIKNIPLEKIPPLIGGCTLFLTSDSGLGHIADAIGVPVVTIFGPSNPKRTAPFRNRGYVIYKNLNCSPCYGLGGCKFSVRKCLEEISVKEVVKVVERVINET